LINPYKNVVIHSSLLMWAPTDDPGCNCRGIYGQGWSSVVCLSAGLSVTVYGYGRDFPSWGY